MANETAFSRLNQRQRRCITLYSDEGRKKTYLNRIESYKACYSNRQSPKAIESAAYRLFRSQAIQDALKEILPPVAYSQIFVTTEYMEHYEEAKSEGNRKDCLDILKEMAKHTGLLDKKKEVADTSDATKFEQQAKEAQALWIKQLEGMSKKTG